MMKIPPTCEAVPLPREAITPRMRANQNAHWKARRSFPRGLAAGRLDNDDKAQRHHAFWLLHEDGGGQEEGIFEETKSSFSASLLLVLHIHLLMRQLLLLNHVRRENEARLFPLQACQS